MNVVFLVQLKLPMAQAVGSLRSNDVVVIVGQY
jgi:hypothetical protein